MKIEQIQFNSFRAYKQEIFDIPKDKNIILLYGRNGFGKTSFFDGVEWGLTGKLERYDEGAKERNEYPLLRNSFSEVNVNDGINIKFDNGIEIKRFISQKDTNDYGKGILSLNGESVSSLSQVLVKDSFLNEISFERSFNFTQLLSQELISNFIRQTKDPDRYKTIVSLFGLNTHKVYDKHINNSKKILNNEIMSLDITLQKERHNLEVEKVKLQNLESDPKIEHEELENLCNQKIDLTKLDDVKNKALKDKENFEIKKVDIENNLKVITYLVDNYNEKELEIKIYNENYDNYKFLENFINLFSKREIYEQIKQNLEKYDLYIVKKEEIHKKEENLNSISYLKKTSNLFRENVDIDDKIKALVEYKKDYLEKQESYFSTKRQLISIDKSIKTLEESLVSLLTMKQMMYRATQEFLVQKDNSNLENCPICDNKFDISETIGFLENKLNSDMVNTDFNSINDSIHQLENEMEKLQQLFEKQTIDFIQLIDSVKNDVEKEYSNLLKESIIFDELKESYITVIDNLEVLKINKDDFDKEYTSFIQKIEKNKEYKKEVSLNYYQKKLEDERLKLTSSYSSFEYYINEKDKFENKTIEGLNEKKIYKNVELENIKNELLKNGRIIELTISLINYFKNNNQLEIIKELTNKVNSLEKELSALNNINNDYDNLKSAIKTTIDNKTKTLLADYEDTIKNFYRYLNPSVYMKELSIRIQENPTLGNRLIFEVMSNSQKKHSPSYIFSSAQNNVLALSIFLSFAIKQQWSQLDSIFLDDPIQNMDDINIHSFVDLIRSIQKQTHKQFFISTHDDRIFNFMLNKFGRENVHTFEYRDYGVLVK